MKHVVSLGSTFLFRLGIFIFYGAWKKLIVDFDPCLLDSLFRLHIYDIQGEWIADLGYSIDMEYFLSMNNLDK